MKKKQKIPVLMYHGIESDDQPAGYDDPGDLLYVLKKEQFYQQMKYLCDNDYHVANLLDLNKTEQLPEKTVVITFDDGHRSDYTVALPILKEFGFTACFYITTGWIGGDNYLLPEHITELSREGMVIGTHGVTHTYFNEMSPDQYKSELKESKNELDGLSIQPTVCFSAPGGRITSGVVRHAVSLGYQSIGMSVTKPFQMGGDVHGIPRIAIKNKLTIDEFEKVVSCDHYYYLNTEIKYKVLILAKKILGNRLYERVRSTLIQ